jgi:ABC-type tungstate transport system substrate-binding protein
MTEELYVLVQFIPRVTYYSGEEIFYQLIAPKNGVKRVAIPTVLIGSLLNTGLSRAASLGVSVLVFQDTTYKAL